jgi:hypothetical protein
MKKLIIIIVAGILAGAGNVEGEILIFDTSDSQFDVGVDNQGWWSDTLSNYDENDNYAIGIDPSGDLSRNFFTFDLSLLTLPVTSARLELTRFNYLSSAESETFGLSDVSTDAVTLNNNVGTSASIYNDLGSGVSYGEFEILSDGLTTDVLSFNLNAAAIGDINAAKGGWFSIGGALLSPSSPAGIFGSSQDGGVQRLVLDVVPEPTTFALLGLGGLLLERRRRFNT